MFIGSLRFDSTKKNLRALFFLHGVIMLKFNLSDADIAGIPFICIYDLLLNLLLATPRAATADIYAITDVLTEHQCLLPLAKMPFL